MDARAAIPPILGEFRYFEHSSLRASPPADARENTLPGYPERALYAAFADARQDLEERQSILPIPQEPASPRRDTDWNRRDTVWNRWIARHPESSDSEDSEDSGSSDDDPDIDVMVPGAADPVPGAADPVPGAADPVPGIVLDNIGWEWAASHIRWRLRSEEVFDAAAIESRRATLPLGTRRELRTWIGEKAARLALAAVPGQKRGDDDVDASVWMEIAALGADWYRTVELTPSLVGFLAGEAQGGGLLNSLLED